MKDKIILNKKEFEGRTFFYNDFGCARHYRTSFRLWINKNLVKNEMNPEGKEVYYIELPCKNAKIEKTEKGTIVMRNNDSYNTYYLEPIICGYRGQSTFEIINDPEALIYVFEEYESPRGNLGIKRGGIISSKKTKLIIQVTKTGRDINNYIYYLKLDLDGNNEEIEVPNIEDLQLLE